MARAVVADVDGEAYAFPLLRIERIARVPVAQVKTLENREFAPIDDQPIALVSARTLFDVEGGWASDELHVDPRRDRVLQGSRSIAQDESTSVVFGMPKAAIELGAAERIVPLDAMAAAIASACC